MKSYRSNLATFIVNTVNSNKKVSRLPMDFQAMTERYLDWCEYVNTLPRWTTTFDGEPLDRYPVVDALAGLIYPESVTVSGSDREEDFLLRDEFARPEDLMTRNEVLNYVDLFYSLFKADAPNTTLASVRGPVSFTSSNVLERFSNEGLCVKDGGDYYPIPLINGIRIFRSLRYNFNELEVIQETVRIKIRAI